MSLIRPPSIRPCAGFTYIGLLILVAIMGVTLAMIGTLWHTTQQRAKEQQLLFIGNQFSQAINAYYQNTPNDTGGAKQFPKKLEDLLQDNRYPNTIRYLRKIFADPMTGDTQWGLIKGADGGIIGVRSLSDIEPIKKSNFSKGNASFANKKHYSEWKFMYNASGNTMLASIATPPPPAKVVPPEYRVPPLDDFPSDPTEDDNNLLQCQMMRIDDAQRCQQLALQFDNAAGLACMASANARYAICITPGHGPLPVLLLKYK
jgi:type II secretory pathway pseudopilin PulG